MNKQMIDASPETSIPVVIKKNHNHNNKIGDPSSSCGKRFDFGWGGFLVLSQRALLGHAVTRTLHACKHAHSWGEAL